LLVTIAVGCARETEADLAGRDTYLRYCASCHGPEGRGDGPVAASLKTQPADLTRIAKRSGGSFDERDVMAAIDGRRAVREHGSRDMPVWGAIFEDEQRGEPYPSYQGLLKTRLLMDYLATLQER
jgi:mono/diheme cytochrome c family protein